MVFKLGLYDTRFALILTYPTFLIPFCTWLLMGYFRSIPFELEECAIIDGASRLQILRRINLVLAVPGLISAGIFAFTLSWNEFILRPDLHLGFRAQDRAGRVLTELVQGRHLPNRGALTVPAPCWDRCPWCCSTPSSSSTTSPA